ncbi:hypothetical protein [Marinobacter sp.]|uniref:hypothetical protein n=1 Tax=Marinobacter sp. TaxID=50741 RepID=UPI003568F8F4
MWGKSIILTLLLGTSNAAIAETADLPDDLQFAVIFDVPGTTLAVQLLAAAYDNLGIVLTTREVPSRRALMMADNGQVDGDLFRIAEVGDRYPNLVRVPYPLLEAKLHAVSRFPGDRLLVGNGDWKPRVAVRRGVLIAEQTAEDLGMVLVHADSYQQMQALLDWGRVDLALVSSIESLSPLDDERWDHLHIIPEPVTRFTLYHYLHRRHANLAEPLAKALEQLDRSGEKARIAERVQKTFNVADTRSEEDRRQD